MVSYSKSVKKFYANAFNFSGRATRAEYWWGFTHYILLVLSCSIVGYLLGDVFKLIGLDEGLRYDLVGNEKHQAYWLIVSAMNLLSCLGGLYIPYLSLIIRRLHDIGISGWILLLFWGLSYFSGITFCIAICLLMALMLLPGNKKENKYGVSPYFEDIKEDEIKE